MKPILFNTKMVKAILEKTTTKRKTQTRRVIKPQPSLSKNAGFGVNGIYYGVGFSERETQNNFISCKSKYQVGDILYVRETWQYSDSLDNPYWYKQHEEEELAPEYFNKIKWRPSIHMPKEAARIFLEVTDVRIERLQDISEEDAKAEGCAPEFEMSLEEYMDKKTDFSKASSCYVGFKHLWKSLELEAGYTWDDNPFVWVYKFKQIENPEL